MSGRADPPFEPGVQHTDRNPAPPLHQDGCDEWCAHCALCGAAVLWGARCDDHLGVYPDRRNTPV